MKPEEDLREVLREDLEPDVPDYEYLPEFDGRWMNVGVHPHPWTFDEVPLAQQIRCKLGIHRGRVESLGGDICFFCSYCGEIIR